MHEASPLIANAAVPWYVYVMSLFASLNSVNLGFDIGVNSGVADLLQDRWNLSNLEIGVFLSSLHFLAAAGGLLTQSISDRYGRCYTFVIAQMLCMLGITVQCLSYSYAMLMLGRIFLGLGIGICMAVVPVYIAELAPASQRGKLTSFAEISINFGILLGFIADYVLVGLPAGTNWRVMLACGGILPVVILVLSFTVIPESPRWLIARGRSTDAEDILKRTHPPGFDTSALMKDIKQHMEMDAEHANLGWTPLLFPDAATRKMMMVGLGAAFAQQMGGSESIVLYSPEIFKSAGVASTPEDLFGVTIWVGVVKTLCLIISAMIIDSVGRRPLLILSTLAMAACEFVLSYALGSNQSLLSVLAVCLFMGVFSLGMAPVAWVLAAESFPTHLRAKGVSMATAINRTTSGLVALTFLPISSQTGLPMYYGIFGSICVGIAIWAICCAPETKGKTLEDVADQFCAGGEKKDSLAAA